MTLRVSDRSVICGRQAHGCQTSRQAVKFDGDRWCRPLIFRIDGMSCEINFCSVSNSKIISQALTDLSVYANMAFSSENRHVLA